MSKKNKMANQKLFDESKKYILPMLLKDMLDSEENYRDATATLENRPSLVKLTAEGFNDMYMYPERFDWLLYTKYIREA